VETIRLAARVHDLGKIGVPDHVLRKPGPLTAEEWELMERHVQIGYDILARFADFKDCRELVLLHHERADGAGYPNAVNEQVNPERYRLLRGAQVIAVADALDAMTSDRPYRSALSLDEAMTEFRRHRGEQWLPEVVDVLEEMVAQPEWRQAQTGGRLTLVSAQAHAPESASAARPVLATA
jgi:putative two-component system response regulator